MPVPLDYASAGGAPAPGPRPAWREWADLLLLVLLFVGGGAAVLVAFAFLIDLFGAFGL